jgi:ubiquinone/menaquinone biosynthesis C-methylase UbiE
LDPNPTGRYDSWASLYELFESEAAIETWRMGIVAELKRFGCGGHRILDIGAGTGIGRRTMLEAFPTSTVVSLDRSENMLRIGAAPPDQAIVADMSNFRIDGASFDFVVSGFDAMNCLSSENLARCLKSVCQALKPGGRLIFDYSTRKMLKYDWRDLKLVREEKGFHMTIRHRYEPLLDRTRVDLELRTADELQWCEEHYHYTVDPFFLHELAMDAGLDVRYVRNIDSGEFSPSHDTHVWVLQRPEVPHA